MELWKKYIQDSEISTPESCTLVRIMMSIPPKTGWVERTYSHLELTCQKRRNQLEVTSLKGLFFLAILKLDVRASLGYTKEIESMGKTFPKI